MAESHGYVVSDAQAGEAKHTADKLTGRAVLHALHNLEARGLPALKATAELLLSAEEKA
jgi:hypothetical protein